MPEKTIALNRRARHEFSIEDSMEAGIVLSGTEIKSIRAGKINLADAFARIEKGEAWLVGAHIAPWEGGNRENHEPKRDRKLLLHRSQIDQLLGKTKAKGLTLIPLKIYITARGKAKLELGLGKGKQLHDRRREIQARDAQPRDRARAGGRRPALIRRRRADVAGPAPGGVASPGGTGVAVSSRRAARTCRPGVPATVWMIVGGPPSIG